MSATRSGLGLLGSRTDQTRLYRLRTMETADPYFGGMCKHAGFFYRRQGQDKIFADADRRSVLQSKTNMHLRRFRFVAFQRQGR